MSTIAALQMCSSNNLDDNLAQAATLIAQAAEAGAKVIVLPEMFAVLDSKVALTLQEPYGEGRIQTFLSESAKAHGVWLVGGTIPISSNEPGRIRSACLVYDATGKIAARYDKMHLFDALITEKEAYKESATTQPGDAVVVVDTPVGKLGLAVCYDIRFPGLFRCLAKKGAEIFIVPAAFIVKTGQAHWEVLARSRAIENACYFVGSDQTGDHPNGRKTYGHSLIVHPWGNILQTKETGIGVVLADINLEELHKIRKAMPVLTHQRIRIG
jgi:deaminated glutathione amidase